MDYSSLNQGEMVDVINKLSHEKESLSSLLSSLDRGIIAVDRGLKILYANDRAARLMGYSPEEIQNRPLNDVIILINQLNSKEYVLPLERMMKEGKTELNPHLDLIDRSGVAHHIEGDMAPAKEGFCFFLLSFSDITGRNQRHEEITRMQKLDALSQLAGGIAHDFNNMLTGIMGMSELIHRELEGEGNDELLSYSKSIIETCERASLVTDDLLNFSRKMRKGCVRLDLNDEIFLRVERVKKMSSRRIEFKTELRAVHSLLLVDPVQIRNMADNLLINALEALPRGGLIQVITENRFFSQSDYLRNSQIQGRGEYYVLRVKDSGMGIDEDTLPHIFEPFYTTKKEGGSGLGLSSVYGSVLSHGGNVSVKSSPGEGAEFTVALPVGESFCCPN